MKYLFCFQSIAQSRHFLEAIRRLRARGDAVTILAVKAGPGIAPPPYLADIPGLEFVGWPEGDGSFWSLHADPFRMARSAAFFADERFGDTREIRARVLRALDPVLRQAASGAPRGERLLATVERAIPPPTDVTRMIGSVDPDVVLVSPLVNHLMGGQADFVKAAHALGVPVGLPAFSWDNFSSKGALHAVPDRVFVWNRTQTDELLDLHGLDRAIVSEHGAWRFDSYRRLRPTLDRRTFCAQYGFDASKPTLLYLGSSPLIAPNEGAFAERWLTAVRGSDDPRVAEANVLLRPHPRNLPAWKAMLETARPERVALQDPDSLSLFDEQALFDTIHNSEACFAVNTSAVLEAAIQGKPVLTVLHPDIADGQAGTLHYAYLTEAGGGLLYEAGSFEEHMRDLSRVLAADAVRPDPRAKAFAAAFLEHPEREADCSRSLIDAIDALARLPKRPQRRSASARALDGAVRALVSTGLLPITPVVDPQVHSMPGFLGGRSVPASLRHPTTLPPFRPLWRRRFAAIEAALPEILAGTREPSVAEAQIVEALHDRFAQTRQSSVLATLRKRCAKRLAKGRRAAGADMAPPRELDWLRRPGGRKYVCEVLLAELERRHLAMKRLPSAGTTAARPQIAPPSRRAS